LRLSNRKRTSMSSLGRKHVVWPGLLVALSVALAGCFDAGTPLAPQASASTIVPTYAKGGRELTGCMDPNGGRWLAMIATPLYAEESTGRVVLLRPSEGEVILAEGSLVGPVALCPLGPDRVFAVWEDSGATGRVLVGRSAHWDGQTIQLGAVETLPAGFSAIGPSLAPIGGSELVAAWQARDGLSYRIASAIRNKAGNWSQEQWVTPADGSDCWAPQVATPPNRVSASEAGPHWIAYDRFVPGAAGGFDVYLAKGHTSYTRTPLALGLDDAMNAQLAVDADERAWVVYESAKQFGGDAGLREQRALHLVALAANGAVQVADLGSDLAGDQRADFPKVHLTADGIALTRRMPKSDYEPRNLARRAFYATWHTHLMRFDGDGVQDLNLLETDGDNENETVVFATPTGLEFWVFSDQREASFPERYAFESTIENPNVLRQFTVAGTLAFPKLSAARAPAEEPGPSRGLAIEQRAPHYLFGDLHRHTSLSRCAGRKDGTFQDAMRYARGPGALDFIAVTDHFQHITPGALWRQIRDVARYHAPGSLVVLPGLERMVKGHSHQNLIWWKTDEMRAHSEASSLNALDTDMVFSIPHMTALADNPFDWSDLIPDLHRAIEIHQGLRGSYEGLPMDEPAVDVPRGAVRSWPLAAIDSGESKGWLTHLPDAFPIDGDPPGLISSSDHGSSSHSYAGIVLPHGLSNRVSQITARNVFNLLHAGESFATTGPRNTPHGLHVSITADRELSLHLDEPGMVEWTVFENGRAWQSGHRQDQGHLLVSGFMEPSGPGKLTFERLRPDGQAEAIGEIAIDSGVAIQSDLIVQPAPKPTDRVRVTVTSDYSSGDPVEPFEATWAQLGVGLRYWLGLRVNRPVLDLAAFGHSGPEVAGTCAHWKTPPTEFTLALEGRPEHALYYVRILFADGHMAWSRLVR
jgi:hypothetical protein